MSMSSSDDPKLPHDVVVEILKRLPVESLLRFRCVSRSWRFTIDDPRFVALHLNHSALHASNWYLLCLDCSDPDQRLCSLFSNESLTLASRSQIEIPFDLPNRYGTVGSCNGLICVTEISRWGYGQTMYLWNLFTRKHKAVRQSGLEDHVFPVEPHIVVGFGFDARSNDYKIVRIFYVLDDDSRCYRGTKPQVEIYSLSTDSWRSLECEVPAVTYARSTVFLNGNLHWFALKFSHLGDEGVDSSIVSFDVVSEVFDDMALPEENFQVDSDGLEVYLAVLNDLLAVFISRGEAVGHRELHSVCSVWVLRDYGVPESWTKLYTFEASGLIIRFDGFAWNGELLMHIDDGEQVSWNPITGQFANLPTRTLSCLVPIVKSLVSL